VGLVTAKEYLVDYLSRGLSVIGQAGEGKALQRHRVLVTGGCGWEEWLSPYLLKCPFCLACCSQMGLAMGAASATYRRSSGKAPERWLVICGLF